MRESELRVLQHHCLRKGWVAVKEVFELLREAEIRYLLRQLVRQVKQERLVTVDALIWVHVL